MHEPTPGLAALAAAGGAAGAAGGSDASSNSGGAFGSSRARGATAGQWSVVQGTDGSSVFLRLQLADGRRQDMRLALRSDGHLNLDGSRWLRSRSVRCD